MQNFIYLFLIFIIACSPQTGNDNKSINSITGNWAFLDAHGNYNEAFFSDTTYITLNMVYGASPYYSYIIKNDSLYSNIDKRRPGLNRIAEFTWLNPDKVILVSEFSRDTLDRIKDVKITLQNTDPVTDSLIFSDALKKRYENFLISKGIMSREEIEQFKNDSIVPEDVMKSIQQ
ncbi:MAG: hypothetical protein K8R74_07095 [Bacteroidales bacterium]|nr:hypothetical protein [Bacteroidales bacterium]